MKNFNVTYSWRMIGTVTINVPDEFNIDQAIDWAKENIDKLPVPQNADYFGADEIDKDNCDFDNS